MHLASYKYRILRAWRKLQNEIIIKMKGEKNMRMVWQVGNIPAFWRFIPQVSMLLFPAYAGHMQLTDNSNDTHILVC